MDGTIRVEEGKVVEIYGRFTWERAGNDILLTPMPAQVRVIDPVRKAPLLRHRRIEPDGD